MEDSEMKNTITMKGAYQSSETARGFVFNRNIS